MIATLQSIEQEYRRTLDDKEILSVDEFMVLALDLYNDIKVEETASSTESDMLLFQYGAYNQGDEHHFKFDMTRQILDAEEEPYQLSLTLMFDPAAFAGVNSHNCWSDVFDSMEAFADYIRSTEGYTIASGETAQTVRLSFEQC